MVHLGASRDRERDPARSGTVVGVNLGSRTLATIAGENNAIESISSGNDGGSACKSIAPRGLGKGRRAASSCGNYGYASCVRVWRTFAGMQRMTADSTKSDAGFTIRRRCVAGASRLAIGSTRQRESVRAAAASRAEGARKCMSNSGFEVDAVRNTSVMSTPQSICES
jgi:hypothetical protein